MTVLVAYYHVRSGHGDEVEAALREMAELVRAHEPQCLVYEANRSQDDPDRFLLYERYRDAAALEAHRETPHFRTIVEERVLPLLEQRERTFYTHVAG